MFKFQLASDLHSEIKPLNLIYFPRNKNADYLILAGDIGRLHGKSKNEFTNILSHANQNWKHTFYVPGNHEFYKQRYVDALADLNTEIDKYPNITLLHRKKVALPGVNLIGCTLWSWIPETHSSEVETSLNDYHLIQDDQYKKINSRFTTTLHLEDVEFLKGHLNKPQTEPNVKTIFVTHHAPTFKNTSNPIYEKQKTNVAFATNLESLFTLNNPFSNSVDIWISGHTHWNYDFIIDKTRLISNQYGYSANERANFNFERVYTI